MKKISLSIIFGSLLIFGMQPLFGDSIRSYESNFNQKETSDKITEFLKKFDDQMYNETETEGFRLRFNAGFWSPFHYDIFAGTLSEKNTLVIIRLEGDSGDVFTMSRILEEEKIIKQGSTIPVTPNSVAVKLDEKYHIYSQSLNLVAPWLAVLHASWNSPRLTSGQTLFRFSTYLLLDGLMVWAGGTGLWQEPFNAKKYGGSIAAALAIPRLIGMSQHANLIRGHNRIAQLGYTFYLE